jgi:hypothetical protein
MDSWMIKYARPSPGKKKAFKVLVAIFLIFWTPVFVFSLYKGAVEPLIVMADKVVTLGVMVPEPRVAGKTPYIRQQYIYAAGGQYLFYQGSRMHWSKSPSRLLEIWYSKLLPRLAFIPATYFVERFPFFALVYGVLFLFLAYVRFVKKEPIKVYLARRIREEVG